MSKQHLMEIAACYRKMQELNCEGLFGMRPVTKSAGESALQARDREVRERRENLLVYRSLFLEMGRILERAQEL